jgi:LysR family transcriptional regulator, nitrogen assimilation regulatory protein
MDINVHRLRYFLRIAEDGSLTRASAVLGIAQPALSRQIRLLEEALGVALFQRTPRGMQLTEDGEQLRAAIAGPLGQLELAVQNVGSPFAHIAGGVVLGMPEPTACVLATPLVIRLSEAFPNVTTSVVVRESGRLVEGMLGGEVDVAIVHGPSADERLFSSDLVAEDLAVVGGPNSSLTADHPLNFDQLAELPLVLPHSASWLRSRLETTALRHQVAIDVRFEIDSLLVAKNVIEAGIAYGILPASAVHRDLVDGRLRYAPISDPPITEHLMLAARPQLVLPRRFVLQFGLTVRQVVADLVQDGTWPATLTIDKSASPG